MEPTTTNAFSSFITSDLFLWILGITMPLLFTYGIWFILRLNKSAGDDGLMDPNLHVPPATGTAERSLTLERVPDNESAVADPLDLARIPSADIPLDFRARGREAPPESGDPEGEALGPIHTIAEIQLPQPEAHDQPVAVGTQAPMASAPKALSAALSNTRQSFFGRLKSMFVGKPILAAGEMDDLEEILYTSDLGPKTVQRLMAVVETRVKAGGGSGFDAVREVLKAEMLGILRSTELAHARRIPDASATQGAGAIGGQAILPVAPLGMDGLEELAVWGGSPAILMVVGVNGAGKTTTIGKLASRFAKTGKKVLVVAGDTFRAAAGDQLKIWTERAQVEIFYPEGVMDPSAVAYAACQKAQSEGFDIVIIDTAGRLHTQKNLMEELKKMKRVVQKLIPAAPHEVLLVLDSNSGQNALIQAREFHLALGVTGVVLTKLDGTAKGGVAIGLAYELQLPIKLIGVGESVEDLRRFSAQEFVDSII